VTENNETPNEELMLYHDDLCGYCWRVRGVIDELGVNVELRDTSNRDYARELIDARGRGTVPVLRRVAPGGESDWMPESSDIIAYLRETYGAAQA